MFITASGSTDGNLKKRRPPGIICRDCVVIWTTPK